MTIPVLKQIESLDPIADHQEIVRLSAHRDFPFDTTRALELALFRTFGVPGISELLDRTGQFARHAQRRYDDTNLLVSEMMEWGYDSDRGRRALRRINQLHGRFNIPNDQFLYVLSTFVFEPIRWNARFGWRPLTDKEKLAWFTFWREVGRRMGIKDIPDDYEAFERFSREYEAQHYRFAECNRRVGEATMGMMCAWFPALLRPIVRSGMSAVMDEPLRAAMGFPAPPAPVAWALLGAMRLRAVLLRWVPRRRLPLLRTEMTQRSYPAGYAIERLGPVE